MLKIFVLSKKDCYPRRKKINDLRSRLAKEIPKLCKILGLSVEFVATLRLFVSVRWRNEFRREYLRIRVARLGMQVENAKLPPNTGKELFT